MMFTETEVTWIMMEIGDDDDEDLTLVKVMRTRMFATRTLT